MDPFLPKLARLGIALLILGVSAFAADAKKAKGEAAAASAASANAGSRKAKSPSIALPDADIPSAMAGKKPAAKEEAPTAKESGKAAPAFEELNFNRTLVIEGKVEKPAVQFTLLKEPPPEKEIRFETSFLQNILKLDRENTFSAGETYGRE